MHVALTLPLPFAGVAATRRTLPQSPAGRRRRECDAALEINEARLSNLASLDVPLDGRSVLEVGAGVGRRSTAYLSTALNRLGFDQVYASDSSRPSRLPLFTARQHDTARDGALLRGVFVASRGPLDQIGLTSLD